MRFILDAIAEYLTVKVRRSDVLSTWAGIRPLAQDPNAASTEAASRDHIVTRDPDGLLTVTGEPNRPPPATFYAVDTSWMRHLQLCTARGHCALVMLEERMSSAGYPVVTLQEHHGMLDSHVATKKSENQTVLLAGGKWTTYRKMAEDAVDEVVRSGKVQATSGCRTVHLPLVGAGGYTPALFTEVAQNYVVPHRPGAIDTNVAKHLAGKISVSLET